MHGQIREQYRPERVVLGDVRYEYAASSQYDSLLVRWDKRNIGFWRGKKVASKDFAAGITGRIVRDGGRAFQLLVETR